MALQDYIYDNMDNIADILMYENKGSALENILFRA
jgi:hypothetical protein